MFIKVILINKLVFLAFPCVILMQWPCDGPYQCGPSTNHLKRAKVQEVITSVNPKKSSGYEPHH
jgi:hypothetical protein